MSSLVITLEFDVAIVNMVLHDEAVPYVKVSSSSIVLNCIAVDDQHSSIILSW
jgi:hypothetical protein